MISNFKRIDKNRCIGIFELPDNSFIINAFTKTINKEKEHACGSIVLSKEAIVKLKDILNEIEI